MPDYFMNRIRLDCSKERFKQIVEEFTTDRKIFTGETTKCFDFNKIVAMPEDLKHTTAGKASVWCAALFVKSLEDDNPKKEKYLNAYLNEDMLDGNENFLEWTEHDQIHFKNEILNRHFIVENCGVRCEKDILLYGKKVLDCVMMYGHADWYCWAINNWGTKWNSCDTVIKEDNNEIYFMTACSQVLMLMFKFAKMIGVDIIYDYSFEKTGQLSASIELKATKKDSDDCECVIYEPYSKESYELHFKLWGDDEGYEYDDSEGTYVYTK